MIPSADFSWIEKMFDFPVISKVFMSNLKGSFPKTEKYKSLHEYVFWNGQLVESLKSFWD